MFTIHYNNWSKSRLDFVKKYISKDYFKSKTLLELGCGYADVWKYVPQTRSDSD